MIDSYKVTLTFSTRPDETSVLDVEQSIGEYVTEQYGARITGLEVGAWLDYDDARYVCDTCGTVGTCDDGIEWEGDECPDADCDGTVELYRGES